MKIEMTQVTVRELFHGYVNNAEEGVFGYGGRLNIRPKYQREFIYNRHRDTQFDSVAMGREVERLMGDPDVTKKSGIFPYLITGDERQLSIRAFDARMRREAYTRQKGRCARCGVACEIENMEADHITPWSKGGKTVAENCQMLCRTCNRVKGDA